MDFKLTFSQYNMNACDNAMEHSFPREGIVYSFPRESWVKSNQKNAMQQGGKCGVGQL
jgi:hypothetical protein